MRPSWKALRTSYRLPVSTTSPVPHGLSGKALLLALQAHSMLCNKIVRCDVNIFRRSTGQEPAGSLGCQRHLDTRDVLVSLLQRCQIGNVHHARRAFAKFLFCRLLKSARQSSATPVDGDQSIHRVDGQALPAHVDSLFVSIGGDLAKL